MKPAELDGRQQRVEGATSDMAVSTKGPCLRLPDSLSCSETTWRKQGHRKRRTPRTRTGVLQWAWTRREGVLVVCHEDGQLITRDNSFSASPHARSGIFCKLHTPFLRIGSGRKCASELSNASGPHQAKSAPQCRQSQTRPWLSSAKEDALQGSTCPHART